jgi:hypothetical protein
MLQSTKWLTEYSRRRATSVVFFKSPWKIVCGQHESGARWSGRAASDQLDPAKSAKTVPSRKQMIMEIISPSALTFKIPFH